MQIQFMGKNVDDEKKDMILEIVSDRNCRTIIESTMNVPKSVIEISTECQIPASTIYRKLKNLCDSKMLGISGSITSEGKKHFLYISKVKVMTSVFNGSNVEIKIVPNTIN